jgi:hypothetical protein
MSRRAVLLCGLFAVASQLSSGCYCCHPFLWRWYGCGAPCAAPGCPATPAFAAPGECCSSCFAPPAYGPANPPPGTVIAGPGAGYVAPPVFTGPPGSTIPPPQVLKDNPMPMSPMK